MAPTGALSCMDLKMYQYTQRLSEMPIRRNGPGLPFQPMGGRRARLLALFLE